MRSSSASTSPRHEQHTADRHHHLGLSSGAQAGKRDASASRQRLRARDLRLVLLRRGPSRLRVGSCVETGCLRALRDFAPERAPPEERSEQFGCNSRCCRQRCHHPAHGRGGPSNPSASASCSRDGALLRPELKDLSETGEAGCCRSQANIETDEPSADARSDTRRRPFVAPRPTHDGIDDGQTGRSCYPCRPEQRLQAALVVILLFLVILLGLSFSRRRFTARLFS